MSSDDAGPRRVPIQLKLCSMRDIAKSAAARRTLWRSPWKTRVSFHVMISPPAACRTREVLRGRQPAIKQVIRNTYIWYLHVRMAGEGDQRTRSLPACAAFR